MIEDSANIQLPARSRLFNLLMAGQCGATQESILSYTQRVCAAHHVPIRRMLIEFILPEAGMSSLLNGQGSRRALDPRNVLSLNACSEHSATFAQAMQRLTGRHGLVRGTFLSWQGLLGRRIAMSQSRRWCAHCVAGQGDREHVAFSLIWAAKDVQACPIHKAMLLERCVRCDHTQPIIGDGPTRGHCEHCRLHLGDALQCDASAAASARDLFNSEAVAEIVSMGDSAMNVVTAARYRSRLEQVKNEQCGGSSRKLASKLQLGRKLLEHDGGTTLGAFLEVTYRLGVKPLAFLTGAAAPSPKYVDHPSAYRPRQRRSSDAVETLRQAISALVHEALRDTDHVIVIADLSRRLDVTADTLIQRCPKLAVLVREHNARARPLEREKRRLRCESIARKAVRDLVEQGGLVTARSVHKAVSAVGVHWTETEARAAANDELALLLRGAA